MLKDSIWEEVGKFSIFKRWGEVVKVRIIFFNRKLGDFLEFFF